MKERKKNGMKERKKGKKEEKKQRKEEEKRDSERVSTYMLDQDGHQDRATQLDIPFHGETRKP